MLLLCTAYRTCTTIPKNKVQLYIEKEYQAECGQGRSTIDEISTAKKILQKCREYNLSVYLAFTDFRQAYNG